MVNHLDECIRDKGRDDSEDGHSITGKSQGRVQSIIERIVAYVKPTVIY